MFTLGEDAKATIAALLDPKIVEGRPVLEDEHQDLGPLLVRILGLGPRLLDAFGRIVGKGDDDGLFVLDPSSVSDVTFDEFTYKVLNRRDIDGLMRMSAVDSSRSIRRRAINVERGRANRRAGEASEGGGEGEGEGETKGGGDDEHGEGQRTWEKHRRPST